jgi:hypothetical protein
MVTTDKNTAAEAATAPAATDHQAAPAIGSALGSVTGLSESQNAPVDTTGLQDRLHPGAAAAPAGPTEPVQVPAALLARVRQAIGEGGDLSAFVARAIASELQRQGL